MLSLFNTKTEMIKYLILEFSIYKHKDIQIPKPLSLFGETTCSLI